MSRTLVRVVCLLALVLAAPWSAAAQQGTAEIRGRVADAQGAVLPGVTVTVRNQADGHVSRDDGQRRRLATSSAASCRGHMK